MTEEQTKYSSGVALRVHPKLEIPEAELAESFSRSSGPGGQNVNKVSTRVELRWNPSESAAVDSLSLELRTFLLRKLAPKLSSAGELVVASEEHRTQYRNREEAREKLAGIVARAMIRPKPRKATRPTRASVKRRLEGKKKRSHTKRQRRSPGED